MNGYINSFIGAEISANKENDKMPIGRNEDEFWDITFATEIAALKVQEYMGDEEKSLTEKCIELGDIMIDGEIPLEYRREARNKLEDTYTELCKVRKIYYKAMEDSNNISDKAQLLFKKYCHTPYYSEKRSKRTYKKLDKEVAGVEDRFYDGFKELYGEEGLFGYRRDNLEKFKTIPYVDVQTAAVRYEKEESLISKAWILLEIPILIAVFHFLPDFASDNGLVVFFLSFFVIRIGAEARAELNHNIFRARYRIGRDLGFINKLTLGWEPGNTYRYDYDWVDRKDLSGS